MKKRVRRTKIICLIFLVIIISASFMTTYIYLKSEKDKPKDHEIQKEENKEPVEVNYKATLVMVGDNLIHSSVYKDASDGRDGYDFTKMYALIKPIVTTYDIAYYNQETILGGKELGVKDYPTFNSPQEVGDAMIDAGFNLVSLASNHTMDSGEKAVLSSRNYWNTKENVLAVGSYASEEERNEVKVMTKNNITYTMLNYTYGTNGMPVPRGKDYLVNVWPTNLDLNDVARDTKYQAYKEQVKTDIERVRNSVDILIVAMHWGVEYTHEPTPYQKDMAKYLASLDVDIIIGTHPHVIQPVTWIDDTLVVYSLGNFISAQYQDYNYNKVVGLMTSLEINKTVKGEETNITINNINNDLVYTYYKNWRNFKVVPFSSPEIANYLPGYSAVYERYKQVVQKYDSNMSVKSLANN